MTPILLVPAGADREVWLAARRQGIGASEISAVLGISPWDSAFSLHHRKANGWEVEETEEMATGTRLEPTIADWWADTQDPLDNLAVVAAGLYQRPERPWQIATPDRLIRMACPDCDGAGTYTSGRLLFECPDCNGQGGPLLAVLECKWTGSWAGWGEPDTDDIPVYYRSQVLWQCDVMGVDGWHLAVLGPGGFRAYCGSATTDAARRDLTMMRTAGARWWADLEAGIPPDVDGHTATAAALRRLHPDVEDYDVEVPVDLAEGYRRARALRARTAAVVDRYEARIRSAIGSGRRAMCGGRLVASRSVYDQTGDLVELDSLDADRPTVNRLNPGRAASYSIPK
jgi:putative phage-type endonuclease